MQGPLTLINCILISLFYICTSKVTKRAITICFLNAKAFFSL